MKHSSLSNAAPPLASYTLEFPAGLIDQGETPKHAALHELWEETGYIGTVNNHNTAFHNDNTNLETCMSPGMSDETTTIIVVDVDLDDPRNDNPIQHLDDGESVVVRRVPLTVGLMDFFNRRG